MSSDGVPDTSDEDSGRCKFLNPLVCNDVTKNELHVLFLSGSNSKKCPDNTFQCPQSTKCIDFSMLCDGRNDCGYFEDEDSFCITKEISCKQIKCSYKCTMSPDGPQCYCTNGYKLANDTCVGESPKLQHIRQ